MTVWKLFAEGGLGPLHLGMLASEALSAFGKPDNYATDADGEPAILKYDEIELHFQNKVLWLIHSERWQYTSLPSAFSSTRLDLNPPEFQWPVELSDLAAAAKTEGLQVELGYDPIGDPQLGLGLATITATKETFVVSVCDYSLLAD